MTSQPYIKRDRDDNAQRVHVFWPVGFHGDPYLLKLVDILAERVAQFVETGTDAGSTLAYVARMYPRLECHSCEADQRTAQIARNNLINHPNVTIEHANSITFLHNLDPVSTTLFWLDAHSHGWGCDLDDEMAIILDLWDGGYIIMDDFQVPHRPELGFDWYESAGPLNWENMGRAIKDNPKIKGFYYPAYPPPFGARGWALLVFGDAMTEGLPDFIAPGELRC